MKHSSFSCARTLNLTSSDVEPHSLSFTGAVNQLALETINGIPQSSLKIYTDGSRVFRSELIAIRRGLQCAAQLEDRFQEIWILTDSRASIQHLANWGDIGDQTSLDILSLLHDLSSGHSIHFQWIPSYVGIEGNERADFWVGLLLWRVLSSRPLQSTYSRFSSGRTRALRFSNGQKTFPECHWCSSGEASPYRILLCLGFKKDEVLCDPLLFLDFYRFSNSWGLSSPAGQYRD
ncbi:putative RNA-directed DNA polymerase from transposon BS [Trichonephila clavipes]|nr:putative RNA-directed DNA polymerase from transposon BS [Trichonephila clavipes]